jgi:hypothetical protein
MLAPARPSAPTEPTMLKFLLPVAIALSAPLAAAADSTPAGAAACSETNPSGGDIRVVTCRFPAGRTHRFTARFGGGHDDTSASLAATLDGRATDCDVDSKMRLFSEDGDVSLHCRVTAGGDAAGVHTLVVTVLWSHAQYRDFVFATE